MTANWREVAIVTAYPLKLRNLNTKSHPYFKLAKVLLVIVDDLDLAAK
jgi:hypothetical protein